MPYQLSGGIIHSATYLRTLAEFGPKPRIVPSGPFPTLLVQKGILAHQLTDDLITSSLPSLAPIDPYFLSTRAPISELTDHG
jgi:hypothetical protein